MRKVEAVTPVLSVCFIHSSLAVWKNALNVVASQA